MSLTHDVRDHIPLEQGLRREAAVEKGFGGRGVRDHIPLEQGLRPDSYSRRLLKRRQRPYSIRTRIKTSRVDPNDP